MASVNKVILVGNLGADPETRYLPSGDAVTNFRIATSERYKDKQTGETKELTEWHRIGTFGRNAENCGQYLRKGSSVYIEGRIRTRKWQDQSGQDKYSTEIVADVVKFLSGYGDDDGGQQGQQQGYQRPSQNAQHQQGNRNAQNQQTPGQRARTQQQAQQGGQQQQRRQQQSSGFEDMEDSVPF